MTHTQVLNLSGNKLTGRLQLGKLKSLGALIVNNNELDALGGLGNVEALNTLVLSHNKVATLSAVFPSSKVPKTLEKLSMGHNLLKSLDPKAFESAANLVELRLGHNKLKEIPTDLSTCPRLRIVDLGGNPIADWEGLRGLSTTKVKNLNLKGCPVAEDPNYEAK